ncbi:S-phase kinase-associated protein 1 [Fukomys damarensis]|uniref:S-phase kinase-associated protein 1 n=1 Tax=Fukomys damarensis TaxID=885580 RepID=A0A091DJ87_FUKDA|nr:S-phase kinase-associated protein 1 [Fukomys damarensis]
MPSIKLQGSDGEIFEVDVEIAKQSVAIKTIMEDLGMDDEGVDDPVPLPNVNAAVLKRSFSGVPTTSVTLLLLRTMRTKKKNYLDIKGLLDITCKTVANMIKGKTPKKITKSFTIKNDFTKGEEALVHKENQWREEK